MKSSFTPVEWCHNTNIYEVNIRQYTPEGTFKAFSQHLSRLRNMGVETLWLMPITPIAMEKRLGTLGSYYACADYTCINPEYGDLDDFKALVKAVHQLEMKIIIDWVANHTGHQHSWAISHPEYYNLDAEGNFTERNGWEDVIDPNYHNADMRNAMVKAMRFWVTEADIDGFRCDMAHLVPLDFWINARRELDAVKPLFWLAECDVSEYHQAFDVSYAWEWMHVSAQFAEKKLAFIALEKVLNKYAFEYPDGALKLFFTTNHDENSWNGTEYEKYGDNALPLAVFCAMWPGIPLVYSGQELPMTKRLMFFDKDEIPWDGNYRLEPFYKRLLELRKRNAAFLKNDFHHCQVLPLSGERQFAFVRSNGNHQVIVMLNFDSNPANVRALGDRLQGRFKNVFTNDEYYELSGACRVVLPPHGYLILEK